MIHADNDLKTCISANVAHSRSPLIRTMSTTNFRTPHAIVPSDHMCSALKVSNEPKHGHLAEIAILSILNRDVELDRVSETRVDLRQYACVACLVDHFYFGSCFAGYGLVVVAFHVCEVGGGEDVGVGYGDFWDGASGSEGGFFLDDGFGFLFLDDGFGDIVEGAADAVLFAVFAWWFVCLLFQRTVLFLDAAECALDVFAVGTV